MIHVTRLSGEHLVVNAELIETLEASPDTLITLTTGRKLLVREGVEAVIDRVLAYRRAAWGAAGRQASALGMGEPAP